jgi:hypothetical protein
VEVGFTSELYVWKLQRIEALSFDSLDAGADSLQNNTAKPFHSRHLPDGVDASDHLIGVTAPQLRPAKPCR